jgi:hypothetical protein
MTRAPFIVAMAMASMAAIAPQAWAQDDWEGRVRAGFSIGVQADTARLAQDVTFTKYIEPAPLTANVPNGSVPWFDGGIAVRLAGNLGAGVAVSFLSNTSTAAVSASIPHPFYLNQPRAIGGEVSGVQRREVATHLDLVYVIASPRIDLALSGGATLFRVDQSFLTDVVFSEMYPYDAADFVSAPLEDASGSKTGYNVGADVTWKVSPRWGFGGIIRFSRASVPFEVNGLDVGTIDVGGLQAGAGLRVMF